MKLASYKTIPNAYCFVSDMGNGSGNGREDVFGKTAGFLIGLIWLNRNASCRFFRAIGKGDVPANIRVVDASGLPADNWFPFRDGVATRSGRLVG